MAYQPPPDPSQVIARRLRLTTPHSVRDILRASIATIADPAKMRADVALLAGLRGTATGKNAEHPVLRNAISEKDAEVTARNLASGLHLIELARVADPYVRPMLVYYGCAQLLGAFTRAFFTWNNVKLSHGLSLLPDKQVGSSGVAIRPKGFFHRLANTFAVLDGRWNLFSDRAEAVPTIGPLPTSPPAPRVSRVQLQALVTYDRKHIDPTSAQSVFPPENDTAAAAMLIDVLVVFIAGSLCRYHPLQWREVLDGRDTSIGIAIESSLVRASTAVVEIVASKLANPDTVKVGGGVSSFGNPYTGLGKLL